MFANLSQFDGGLFNELRRVSEEMDRLFGARGWPSSIRAELPDSYPPMNIGSTPEQIDVYLFAAGIDPKSFDISIQQNLLTVAGERRLVREEGASYYRTERYNGAFRRVVSLPDDVDPDQVEATYKDGVLHICIKRREAMRPRQIEVR